MASIYDLKPRFQGLLRPIKNGLYQKGITANQVTVTALLLSIALGGILAVFAYSNRLYILLPLFLFFRMALNAIDGMLARENHQASDLGAILNELGDVLADTALYLPFALTAVCSPILIVIIVILSIITEMVGMMGIQIGASRRYDGPCGKSDRAVLFSVLSVLYVLNYQAAWFWGMAQWGMIALLTLTVINRVKQALAEKK
jgi:CDP-diacylglycerol--glycerol-3-phosphate 3-phosphatidyltransferase